MTSSNSGWTRWKSLWEVGLAINELPEYFEGVLGAVAKTQTAQGHSA